MTLAKRITHVETPHAAVPAVNEIAGIEWLQAKGQAQRAATNRHDVRAFGAVGTSNDSPTFQAAIDAVAALGGGTLTGPAGTYRFLTGLTLRHGVYLDFPGSGAVTFDFTGVPTAGLVQGCLIFGEGTLTPLPKLSAAAMEDTDTATFVTAPALAQDNVILFYNPTDYSFAPFDFYYREGEFARVLSVSGTTVTTTTRRLARQTSSVDMYKVNAIRTGVSGIRAIGKIGTRLIKVRYGEQLDFHDLDLSGCNYSHLDIDKCYHVSLANVRAIDYSPAVGTNYGVSIINSQHVYADSLYVETTRHGLTLGGDTQIGCIPNRDIRISDSFLGGGFESGIVGCNFHGNCEYVKLDNCTLPSGFNPAGDKVWVNGCTIRSTRRGDIAYSGSLLGADIWFTNNHFIATGNHPNSLAFIYISWDRAGISRTGGTFRFNHNVVDLGPYVSASGSTNALFLYIHENGSLPRNNKIEAIGNEIRSTATPTGLAMGGITLRCGASRAIREVRMTGNRGPLGIRTIDLDTQFLDLSDNAFTNVSYAGIEVQWKAAPLYATSDVIARDVTVIGAQYTGILLGAHRTGSTVVLDNVTALDCAQNTALGSSASRSSMYVFSAATVIRRNAIVGDRKTPVTQVRAETFDNIGTLIDYDPLILGTVTTSIKTNITNPVRSRTAP